MSLSIRESISQLAKAARGSLRDCLTITDQAIAFTNGKLVEKDISQMLGTLPQDQILKILGSIIEKNPSSLLNALKEISSMSVDYQRLMDLLLESIQNIALIKFSPSIIDELDVDKDRIQILSELISQTDIQVLYQIGLIAKRDLDLAPNMDDGFEMAMLRMISFLPIDEYKSKKKIETNQKVISNSKEQEKIHNTIKEETIESSQGKGRAK
ncbi:MAG: hypothetical protein Ct9H90mP4_03550 [Gammaproteobacteria bacterium]|nr:MAG: hypothetical protein Ct9H90mP4_03550 [Gammaproteobacteria bacterium]